MAARKSSITDVAKIYSLLRKALTSWIKLLKFGREEKLFVLLSRHRKTKLNQAQLQQIEGCIEGENPNTTIKEMRIGISLDPVVDILTRIFNHKKSSII